MDSTLHQLDEATSARIRAEEVLRLELRGALTPVTKRSGFDKTLALLNTNVGIGTIGAIILGVGTWAFTQIDDHLHSSERAAEKARVQSLADVQNVAPFLPMLAKEGSPERALACRILAHMIATKAINDTLGQGLATEAGSCIAATLQNADSRPENKAAGLAIADALGKRTADDATVAATSTPQIQTASAAALALARALPKRIYIQYASEAQRQQVASLRAFYEAKGWIVPAAENVGSKAPKQLQVRYFNDDDEDAASTTLALLIQTQPFRGLPHADAPKKLNLKAPPGQIEVWLPQDQSS